MGDVAAYSQLCLGEGMGARCPPCARVECVGVWKARMVCGVGGLEASRRDRCDNFFVESWQVDVPVLLQAVVELMATAFLIMQWQSGRRSFLPKAACCDRTRRAGGAPEQAGLTCPLCSLAYAYACMAKVSAQSHLGGSERRAPRNPPAPHRRHGTATAKARCAGEETPLAATHSKHLRHVTLSSCS